VAGALWVVWMVVGCKWVRGLPAILWLAFCIWGLVVVVMFFIALGVISTICFVAFVVFTFRFGTFIIIMVVDSTVIIGAFFDGWGMIVGFVVVMVSGGHRLLVILWLACCSH